MEENNTESEDLKPKAKRILPKHDVIVINGKERKISKQSQYILDMLILDDEEDK